MRTRYIVVVWLLAAVVAVAASIAAVGIARGGLFSHPGQPMTAEEVKEELSEAPTDATPNPSGAAAGDSNPSPTEQPSGQLDAVPDEAESGENEAVFPSGGGTVLARCVSDGRAELVWWVAEQGYSADDDVVQGPAHEAEVEFEGAGDEFEFSVTCADGEPRASIEVDD